MEKKAAGFAESPKVTCEVSPLLVGWGELLPLHNVRVCRKAQLRVSSFGFTSS